jgi:putative ABC transport system permease protein
VVPFSWARGEGVVPDGGLWLPPVLAAAAIAVAVGSAAVAARRVRFQSA